MILINKIRKEIKKGLNDKSILTENDAKIIAKKYITDDEPSYEITLSISNLLPKRIKEIIFIKKYKHPWFFGRCKTLVYEDTFGRIWSKTKVVLKNGIKTKLVNEHYIIDNLGGMSWRSKNGRTFICQYRTDKDEMNGQTLPQTFIN